MTRVDFLFYNATVLLDLVVVCVLLRVVVSVSIRDYFNSKAKFLEYLSKASDTRQPGNHRVA